MIIVTTTTTSV